MDTLEQLWRVRLQAEDEEIEAAGRALDWTAHRIRTCLSQAQMAFEAEPTPARLGEYMPAQLGPLMQALEKALYPVPTPNDRHAVGLTLAAARERATELKTLVSALPSDPLADGQYRAGQEHELNTLAGEVRLLLCPQPAKPRKRRRAAERKPRPLTAKQTEALQLVAEHKGNVTAAAKITGKSRQAMQKLYDKGMTKLGRSGSILKPKTQRLPHDRRGQATVEDTSDGDD